MSLNGHNRNEVYSEYSIKQVFFYFKQVVNIKNADLINSTVSRFIAAATIQSGKADVIKNYINQLESK